MATVRCPKCGTINPNGRRRLARCRRCGEALGKCRYCRHYDPQLLDCTSVTRGTNEKILDADAVLNCSEFSSLLVTGESIGWLTWRRLWKTAALAIAVAAIFVGVRWFQAPRTAPPVLLKTSLRVPATSFQDEGFEVTVLVRNQADHPARSVQVLVSGRSMNHLICQWVDPSEAFMEASSKSVRTLLGDLEPGEIRSVQLHFSATKPGELDLTAHITAANLETPARLRISSEVIP